MHALRPMRALWSATAVVLCALAGSAGAAGDVIVNGVPLDQATQRALERAYRVPIRPGRYWYDPVAGVWGVEGGPAIGQLAAGLPLGGPLQADASRGTTGVFVNGRQLHTQDVAALSRCVPVVPGRYWVLSNGVGGAEGGPAQFNLAALCGARSAGRGGARCDDYGSGRFNCSNPNTGIGIISEGGGKAGVFVDGKVISTPN